MTCQLVVRNLSQYAYSYNGWFGRKRITAIENINFELAAGKTLAIVGESGSGKSSLAKLLAGINRPSEGDIFVNGEALQYGDYTRRCRLIRMIFQDPDSALNPKLNIGRILSSPLRLNTQLNEQGRRERVRSVLKTVGLLEEHADFYPQMLSNGQKQRVSLARAIILNPKIIIIDESIATLDVSVRAQIVNLLLELQHSTAISYVIVSNDLSLVRHISDTVIVMHQGRAVEHCATEHLFSQPQHEMSQRLLQIYNNEFKR